jgi:hypothetical protein
LDYPGSPTTDVAVWVFPHPSPNTGTTKRSTIVKRTKTNGHARPESRTPEGRFALGSSGNPGGRPRGVRHYREALEEAGAPELLVEVLLRGLRASDIWVAFEAYDRAAAYLYGRPGTLEMGPNMMMPIPSLEEVRRVLEQPDPSDGNGAT